MTTLPAHRPDVWRLATPEEKIYWLSLLSSLRSWEAADPQAQSDAFELVLDDVTLYGLSQAITLILKGKAGLKHDNPPSPKELRTCIDAVMDPFIQAERRERQFAEQMAERKRLDAIHQQGQSRESRARVAAIYAAYCAEHEAGRDHQRKQRDAAERADAASRNGITAETLASVDDAPLAGFAPVARAVGDLLRLPAPDVPPSTVEPSDRQRRNGLDIRDGVVAVSQAWLRRIYSNADGEVTSADHVLDRRTTRESFAAFNAARAERGKPPIEPIRDTSRSASSTTAAMATAPEEGLRT